MESFVVAQMPEVKCSVCRQPIDSSVWHIVGFRDPKTGNLIFLWKMNDQGQNEVVFGSNVCVRRYYTKNPEHKQRLKELLTR